MKKFLTLLAFVAFACSAQASFFWSTWDTTEPDRDYRGCEIGLLNYSGEAHGAQINLFSSRADEFYNGCQFTILGYTRATKFSGGAQLGLVTRSEEFRKGVQVGLFNSAKSSSLQIGLICHNESGFLPWFPFFNFSVKK